MSATQGTVAGRGILITGGAGGLAGGVARELLAGGAQVILSDLPGEALDRAREELSQYGQVTAIPADVTNEEQVDALVASAAKQAGRLDGFVGAAGILRVGGFDVLSAADFEKTMNINLTGTFIVLQRVANYLAAHPREDGGTHSCVLFSSVAGRLGRPDISHYAASKAGVISIARSAAFAYAPKVRINAVAPGMFLTSMWDTATAAREEKFGPGAGDKYMEDIAKEIPLGRTGKVEELGALVRFLLEDGSGFITGQTINIDGGIDMN
ncbi:SDR family oxidoreductase [Arthrobacter bambusae]|uniref:SDR family NAD(P)-dependent oxidoreductase n=1 Tax=Arthrobacter bambusae TaxID=1338426 RepID=UPI001F510883|nr:SDR family oxidoreductase [Arthrobacter bambusae]MCI0144253.1 SDR family oxidoreductase [Arthrobacter bambusae]